MRYRATRLRIDEFAKGAGHIVVRTVPRIETIVAFAQPVHEDSASIPAADVFVNAKSAQMMRRESDGFHWFRMLINRE